MKYNFSTKAFFDFLYELPSLGLINEATARNLKNSALLLLSVIDLNSSDDVRQLDVEELISRYVETQSTKPGDSTLQSYQSRFKSAVSKFEEYVRLGTVIHSPETNGELEGLDGVDAKFDKIRQLKNSKPHTFNLPILIRPETGIMITIQGLPTDITQEEAERVLSILKAYVRA
ncbi:MULTISPECIES: hypothetical protein [Cronobacter]|uniref:hypothetical protein n=1 Tax=Cronobacter TaxID=413496 RepID=UPI0024AF787C|nr:hypothetical protein [Cronobacter malonaticus]ELY2640086.1 hypothetical protein [Cronobacter sakazakii]ELY4814962.1 hypothetical protein [Cronobacter sakazakii]MDI7690170.1 hypothetical protein [Cronobacter malonaticus]MDK1298107.1 hypothetical protein [Cronobacter malonaticus]